MEQQQPTKAGNLILFLLLSTTVLIGWIWLQQQLWPPAPKDKGKAAQQQKDKAQKKPKAKEKKPSQPEPKQAAVLSYSERRKLQRLVASMGNHSIPLGPALAWSAGAEAATPRTFELGGDGYFTRAVLTTRGAGVQRLTLTQFDAADWWGQPRIENGKRVPMDLIAEDPENPSFCLYHYPDPTLENDDRPVTTLGEEIWTFEEKKATDDGGQEITFSIRGPKGYEYLLIRKTYSLHPKDYHLGLTIEVEDTGEFPERKRQPFRYQLAGAHGLPLEGGWYSYVHRNAMIGIVDGRGYLQRVLQQSRDIAYWRGGNRVPEGARQESAVQYGGVVTQYFASIIALDHEKTGDSKWKGVIDYVRPTLESREHGCVIIALDKERRKARLNLDNERTVTVTLLPRALRDLEEKKLDKDSRAVVNLYTVWREGRKLLVAGQFRRGTVPKEYFADISVRMVSAPLSLEPKVRFRHQFVLYHGPVKVRQLSRMFGDQAVDYDLVEHYASTLHLETLTDYPWAPIWKTLFWTDLLIFCTKLMHWLLTYLYVAVSYVNFLAPVLSSEGLAIVLLTVIVRGAMFPISRKQALTSIKMQQLAPEMKKLREKYKDKPQELNREVWALYKKYNVNPMGGCLPMFLQLPVFLSLYYALQESTLFRLAPFLYISNLSAPDMLFWWGEGIPWISNPDSHGGMLYLGPYFNLLPVLAVTIMLLHQKLVMPPPADEQQEMQQKMMKYMMIVFAIMFYKVAAGLCLYFIASSLWGMAERRLLPKKETVTLEPKPLKSETAKVSKKAPSPAGKKKARRKRAARPVEEQNGLWQKLKKWWEDVLEEAKAKRHN